MLKHRTRRPVLSPCPSHARPPPACAHRCAQPCSVGAGCSAGCLRDHREDRAAGVAATLPRTSRACLGRPNCTPARDSTARHLRCLGMGALPKFVPSAGREGVGGRVAGERDPEARDAVGSGLGHRGSPHASSHACSRPHYQHELNARAPPPTPRPFSPDGAVFGIGFDDPRATWVLRVVDLHSRRPEGRADRR